MPLDRSGATVMSAWGGLSSSGIQPKIRLVTGNFQFWARYIVKLTILTLLILYYFKTGAFGRKKNITIQCSEGAQLSCLCDRSLANQLL